MSVSNEEAEQKLFSLDEEVASLKSEVNELRIENLALKDQLSLLKQVILLNLFYNKKTCSGH